MRCGAIDAGILHLGGTRLPAGNKLPFGLTVTILAAYGCLAVIDAFFLAGGLSAADWIQRGAAFADLEAPAAGILPRLSSSER